MTNWSSEDKPRTFIVSEGHVRRDLAIPCRTIKCLGKDKWHYQEHLLETFQR